MSDSNIRILHHSDGDYVPKESYDKIKEECERLKAQLEEITSERDGLQECCDQFNDEKLYLVKCVECKKQVTANMCEAYDAPIHLIEGGEIVERDNTEHICFQCLGDEKLEAKDAEIARLREALSGLYSHLGHDWCPVCDENAIHCEMGKARDALSISTSNESGGKNV